MFNGLTDLERYLSAKIDRNQSPRLNQTAEQEIIKKVLGGHNPSPLLRHHQLRFNRAAAHSERVSPATSRTGFLLPSIVQPG